MNLFQKIKALWTIKGVVDKEIKEGKMETVSGKPGWKTTEFWLTAMAQVGIIWGSIQGLVPPKYAAIVTVAGTALYTIARTIAKAVQDVQAAKRESTTVTTTQPITTVTTPA